MGLISPVDQALLQHTATRIAYLDTVAPSYPYGVGIGRQHGIHGASWLTAGGRKLAQRAVDGLNRQQQAVLGAHPDQSGLILIQQSDSILRQQLLGGADGFKALTLAAFAHQPLPAARPNIALAVHQ